jgi:large subunit ribosomal protein L17
MRHNKKTNQLGRKSTHRKAMLANMAASLIMHKRIRTTLAKAKALRIYVEPLINRSKEDTTHSRRMVFRHLQSKEAVTELFREISTKVADRPGGYTRILKLGPRLGDSAEMALIELVDFNPNLLETKAEKKAKTTRRGRRPAGKKTEPETAAAVAPATIKEAPPAAAAAEPASEAIVEAPVEEDTQEVIITAEAGPAEEAGDTGEAPEDEKETKA